MVIFYSCVSLPEGIRNFRVHLGARCPEPEVLTTVRAHDAQARGVLNHLGTPWGQWGQVTGGTKMVL